MNLFDELREVEARRQYASREPRFGDELGATLWGGTVYELEPGERVCPALRCAGRQIFQRRSWRSARTVQHARAKEEARGGTMGSSTSLAECVLSGKCFADDERVHLVRALVREHGLEIVHVADHRVLERDPVAAENRACATRDVDRAADVAHLAHAHMLGPQSPLVLHATEVQGDERRAVDLERHFGELLLRQLIPGDGLAEDHALLRIL